MFDHLHYVPLLKGKQGEFGALKELSDSVKMRLTPLIDVPRADWDWGKGKPKKSLDAHIETITKQIEKSWGAERPFFIDFFDADLSIRTSNGTHPITCLTTRARNLGLKAIPVTGLDRDSDLQAAVALAIKTDDRGVCIRLLQDDLADLVKLRSELAQLMNVLSVPADLVDLLLDLRELREGDVGKVAELAIEAIGFLPCEGFRTLTVAGSGFPRSLGEVASQSIGVVPRTEWVLRQELMSRISEMTRCPTFGDYAVAHPDLLYGDMRTFSLGGSIRYTLADEWLILKGGSFKKYKHAQFHDLARTLSKHSGFKGANYSWGDNYIAKCAAHSTGPGNLMTWRKVGTSHHLMAVVDQISEDSA